MVCTFPYWNSKEYFKEGYFFKKKFPLGVSFVKMGSCGCPCIRLSARPSICLPVCLSVHLSVCESVGLSVSQPVSLSACPSVRWSVSLDQGLTQSVSPGCLIHRCDIDPCFWLLSFPVWPQVIQCTVCYYELPNFHHTLVRKPQLVKIVRL